MGCIHSSPTADEPRHGLPASQSQSRSQGQVPGKGSASGAGPQVNKKKEDSVAAAPAAVAPAAAAATSPAAAPPATAAEPAEAAQVPSTATVGTTGASLASRDDGQGKSREEASTAAVPARPDPVTGAPRSSEGGSGKELDVNGLQAEARSLSSHAAPGALEGDVVGDGGAAIALAGPKLSNSKSGKGVETQAAAAAAVAGVAGAKSSVAPAPAPASAAKESQSSTKTSTPRAGTQTPKGAQTPKAPSTPRVPPGCIEILAFEVASVVVRAINLRQSLLERDIEDLRQEVLASEGIRMLVSDDLNVVWGIAAEDKRGELRQVAMDVVRLGMQCSPDSPMLKLHQRFDSLGTPGGYRARLTSSEAEAELKQLEGQAQVTADLYHELTSLENMQQALKRKTMEESAGANKDLVVQMKAELRAQEKMVKMMKKQGLWSRRMDEVVDSLSEIVVFLHDQIVEIFGPDVVQLGGLMSSGEHNQWGPNTPAPPRRLGTTGMALQYANIINMIDALVLRPSILDQKREELFSALPSSITGRLKRTLLLSGDIEQESTESIRQKMEGVLDWLVTMAENTVRYGLDLRMQGYTDLTLLQTLHHVEEQRMENLVLLLLVGLQHLVSRPEDPAAAHTQQQLFPPVPRLSVVAPFPPPTNISTSLQAPATVQGAGFAAGPGAPEPLAMEATSAGVAEPVPARAAGKELEVPAELALDSSTTAQLVQEQLNGFKDEPMSSRAEHGLVVEAGTAKAAPRAQAPQARSSLLQEIEEAAELEDSGGLDGGFQEAGVEVEGDTELLVNLELGKPVQPSRLSRDSGNALKLPSRGSSSMLFGGVPPEASVGEEWLKVMAKSQGFPKERIEQVKASREAAASAAAAAAGLPKAVVEAMRGKAKSQAFGRVTAGDSTAVDGVPRSSHSKSMSRALLAALAEADAVDEVPRVRPMTAGSALDVDRLREFSIELPSAPQGLMQERILQRKLSGSGS